MSRRAGVVVAIFAIAGCAGSDEDAVEQEAQIKLAAPTVTVLSTTDSSIRVQVCAGASGAKAGFTIQWISAEGRATSGWEANPERCDGSFSGQAQASTFALAPNACTTLD